MKQLTNQHLPDQLTAPKFCKEYSKNVNESFWNMDKHFRSRSIRYEPIHQTIESILEELLPDSGL
jgi:hypothetical protein